MSVITHPRTLTAVARDYMQLTKPRIMLLLVFTMVTAMVVAGEPLPPVTLVGAILGGCLAAGGASALNQYLDRELDQQMARTKHRPIPAARVAPGDALIFGLALLAWSALIFAALVNLLAAGLALFGAFYYVVLYTVWLKRHTTLNIVLGGGAGAMPVLVGWAAATGTLSLTAVLLFGIVFLWTPPHSWALALAINSDYERGRIPMMSSVYGAPVTVLQILIYTLHLVPLTLLPLLLGTLGAVYAVLAVLLNAGLVVYAVRLYRSSAVAWQMYKYSSFYLAMLFLVMIVDRLLVG